jgi:hypothetical protein
MRRLLALTVLAVLGFATAACNPCAAAVAVHHERCGDGDTESCEWLSQHDTGIVGVCAP